NQLTALPVFTLQPGQYFLVQQAAGTTPSTSLPTPDAAGTINMSGTAGKVALVNSTTSLGCNGGSAPCDAGQQALILDLVGFGNANFFEGTAVGTLSNTTAALRNSGGCTETDNNAADFTVAAPAPRNTSSPLSPCGGGGTPTVVVTPSITPTSTVTLVPTVTNTPGPATRIREIQGAAHISPLVGQAVTSVPGIVTALKNNGFYLQDPSPDADNATSEAIFVFTSSVPTVSVGMSVLVNGNVAEFRPGGAATNLTITEITGPSVSIVSSGNPLPAPVVLGNGGRTIPTTVISNDAVGGTVENPGTVFDPAQDGIDFYESLEGMLVQVNDALVTGPSNSFNEIWVLADNGANATGRSARGGVIVSSGDFNPERIQIDDVLVSGSPDVSLGDRFSAPIVGVIDYDFGNYQLQNTQALPSVIAGGLAREVTSLTATTDKLTIGTFNVENLAPGDGPSKFNALAAGIVTNLGAPDIVNIEEVQDNNGTASGTVDADVTLQTLINAISVAGGPTYQYRQINPVDGADGGAPGGNIRVAFLFNPARVQFVDRPGGTSTASTTVVNAAGVPQLSFSPGRIDPTNPAFTSSRKPLVGEFIFNGRTVFAIANHFNSKGGDEPLFGQAQPPTLTSEVQRLQQANVLKGFVQSILAIDPNALIVAAGDFNDFEFSPPLQVLQSGGLTSLVTTLPANQRYSYVFDGNSQTLDHILVSPGSQAALDGFDVVHMNAEFWDQISDHDPSVARFTLAAAPTPTPTSSVTLTPTQTSTAVPSSTPTLTPTVTATATTTATAAATATPAPAGTIQLRLAPGLAANRALRYDPPGPPGLQVQTFDHEPGCGQFEANPNLMQVTGASPSGQPRQLCLLAFRMGVDKGPRIGPLDNFRVNQGEKVTFALGSHASVAGKKIRTAQIKVESNPQTTIRVTAYNGSTSVGTQTVPVNSLSPQGKGNQANNYTINVDLGQPFTRLELETLTGSFSIVGGANDSGETEFILVN
ncbi:MAG: endonuclease/exonuclease/phosphatase family protein, partial [Chloroflexota bacterium]